MKHIHKLRIWAVFVTLLIGGLASFFGLLHHQALTPVSGKKQSRKVSSTKKSKGLQYPVYPYSVIPGGVRTSIELKQAVDSDPVVKQHYIGFKISQAHPLKNEKDRKVFVSFRKGNQVFWTRKRVSLPAGELLIADGEHIIRTRCGNRISETAQAETTTEEPSEEEMNGPELANNILAFAGQPVTSKTGGTQQTETLSSGTPLPESKEVPIVASEKESLNLATNGPLGSGSLFGGLPGNLPGGSSVPTEKLGSTAPTAPLSAITFNPTPTEAFPLATIPLLNTFLPSLSSSLLGPVFSPRVEQTSTIPLLPPYMGKVAVGQILSLPPQNLAVILPENLVIQIPGENLKPIVSVSQTLPTLQPEVTTPEVSTIGLVAGALGLWIISAAKRRDWLQFH